MLNSILNISQSDHVFFQVWLLEINVNPALHTNCEVLKELLPGVVEETLGKWPKSKAANPPVLIPQPTWDNYPMYMYAY